MTGDSRPRPQVLDVFEEWLLMTARNLLEIHYPDQPIACGVREAAFLAVRYSGGIGVVIVVTCDEGPPSAEDLPPISPTLQLILPLADLPLDAGSRWEGHFREVGKTGIGVPPLITDYDFRLVMDFRAEVVSRDADTFHLRCAGRIPTFAEDDGYIDATVDANFEFRGYVDHGDESLRPVSTPFSLHTKSKGNWQKYLIDELSLQSGRGALTEYEWRHSARFRRIARQIFAYRTVPAPGPPRNLMGRIRSLFAKPPSPATDSEIAKPTNRQALLVLTAAAERFLIVDEREDARRRECREILQTLERYADRIETETDRQLVRDAIEAQRGYALIADEIRDFLRWGTEANATLSFFEMLDWRDERRADFVLWRLVPERSRWGCDFLRDIFGDPFQPVTFDPAWRTETVIGLATAAYDGRDFSLMPILADALQDAGCDNSTVLAHCRSGRPHVRGCWVVDGLLGKE